MVENMGGEKDEMGQHNRMRDKVEEMIDKNFSIKILRTHLSVKWGKKKS